MELFPSCKTCDGPMTKVSDTEWVCFSNEAHRRKKIEPKKQRTAGAAPAEKGKKLRVN
jgi:hypothetical protein